MDLAEFSGSRDTSVGSSEGFGGLSRKFLCTYTLKVSIKHIFTGGNDPQHLTAPEIVVKISENPDLFRFSILYGTAILYRANLKFLWFWLNFRVLEALRWVRRKGSEVSPANSSVQCHTL